MTRENAHSLQRAVGSVRDVLDGDAKRQRYKRPALDVFAPATFEATSEAWSCPGTREKVSTFPSAECCFCFRRRCRAWPLSRSSAFQGGFVATPLLDISQQQGLRAPKSQRVCSSVWHGPQRSCWRRSRLNLLIYRRRSCVRGPAQRWSLRQSAAFDDQQHAGDEPHRSQRLSAEHHQRSRSSAAQPRSSMPTDQGVTEHSSDASSIRPGRLGDGNARETTIRQNDRRETERADTAVDMEGAAPDDGFPGGERAMNSHRKQAEPTLDGHAPGSCGTGGLVATQSPAEHLATDHQASASPASTRQESRVSPWGRFATIMSGITTQVVDRAFGAGTTAALWKMLNHDPSQIHPQLADPNAAYEIEFENVYKSFESRPVLKGLNLRIRRGEAVGIMGRSGCGKSTTLRLIAGFELPDAGSVRIRGWTRDEPIRYELGPIKIGMVFQHAALFDSLTVFENVAFELQHNTNLEDAEIEGAVDAILTRLGLRDTRDLLPSQLSGGMRKRVSLARSLVSDQGKGAKPLPDLLLYDEPTAGLDPIASTRIENLIREVRETVPTCIVVSHQLSTIKRTVDRVVLLHGGRIRWDGPVSELECTENLFVRQLLSGNEDGPMSGPEFDPDSTLYMPDDLDEA